MKFVIKLCYEYLSRGQLFTMRQGKFANSPSGLLKAHSQLKHYLANMEAYQVRSAWLEVNGVSYFLTQLKSLDEADTYVSMRRSRVAQAKVRAERFLLSHEAKLARQVAEKIGVPEYARWQCSTFTAFDRPTSMRDGWVALDAAQKAKLKQLMRQLCSWG